MKHVCEGNEILMISSRGADAGQGMVISTHFQGIRSHQALECCGDYLHVTSGKLYVGHF